MFYEQIQWDVLCVSIQSSGLKIYYYFFFFFQKNDVLLNWIWFECIIIKCFARPWLHILVYIHHLLSTSIPINALFKFQTTAERRDEKEWKKKLANRFDSIECVCICIHYPFYLHHRIGRIPYIYANRTGNAQSHTEKVLAEKFERKKKCVFPFALGTQKHKVNVMTPTSVLNLAIKQQQQHMHECMNVQYNR